jgi:hypothetical protein
MYMTRALGCVRNLMRRRGGATLTFDVDRAASLVDDERRRRYGRTYVSQANGNDDDSTPGAARFALWLCVAITLGYAILALILAILSPCTLNGDNGPPMASPPPTTPAPGTSDPCEGGISCPYTAGPEAVATECTVAGTCDGDLCIIGNFRGVVDDECIATNESVSCTLDECACVVAVFANESLVVRECVEPPPPTPAPTVFDCCPQDEYVGLESPYASASPTLCGHYDYNCDGVNDTYPCCYDVDAAIVDGERLLYNASECAAANGDVPLSTTPEEVCGACEGNLTVVPGWSCSSPISRKRFVLPCPASCDGTVETSASSPPDVGECALFTDHCVPPHGGDGEQCCLVVNQ